MNKLNMLLAGVAAMGLTACGNEDLSVNPDVPTDDVAYLTVNIKDANAGRAVTTPGFISGVETEECEVASAKFLFYNSNGAFMAEANIWDPKGEATSPDAPNVEYLGKNVVVLKGLKEAASYPKYMITVLNAPESLQYGYEYTMEQTRNSMLEVSDIIYEGENNKKYFVMSTTSFFGEDENDKYYANTLVKENFRPEPVPAEPENPVTVYVERLSAKVEATTDKELHGTTINGEIYYELPITVGGNLNPGEGMDPDDENAAGGVATSHVYIKINGWGLNATTKCSYLSKNLDGWNSNTTFDGWQANEWNVPGFHRSYWGKSVVYGTNPAEAEDANLTLNYVNWDDLKVAIGDVAYCAENTNSKGQLWVTPQTGGEGATGTPVFDASKVTSVLVSATVCDGEGKPLSLIQYNSLYYEKESFVKYELAALKAAGNLEYYTYNGTGTPNPTDVESYTQITKDDVEIVSSGQGTGYVKLQAKLNGKDLYKKATSGGKSTFTKLADASELNTRFDNFVNSSKAMIYEGGAMYYTIPVEHLNSTTETAEKNVEAKYGVVRNHWYKINITKLARLGHGVYDPEEEVIKPELDETPSFYMGAEIKILAWKVVNQNVDLD